MERYLLKENIWWVGAIDWNARDFHGYETPRGTTYNSYLITDQKTTLVDGVRSGFGSEVLRRISSCCDPRGIDYLVINHVEMDHSGAIPELIRRMSPVKIFCSKRAKDALALLYAEEGFEEWDIQVVGTGDEIELGTYTITFLEVPMLHWPDSMLTYVKEAKVLLSNDGFGQHLATSNRFADEVGLALAMDEAAKYYANILMPFAAQVQKLVKTVGEMGLELDVIAPSHGVIWRRPPDVQAIIQSYVDWSAFKAEPSVALIFDTMWHSTEKMTRAIEDGVAQEGVTCSVIKLSKTPLADAIQAIQACRGFFVGTPTLNNTMLPSVGAFMTYIKGLRPRQRLTGAYGSFGWGGGGVKHVDAGLRELGLEVVDPLELKYVPSTADLAACEEYGREIARRVKAWEA